VNAGATEERVYSALKSRIMDRIVRPGQRLDVTTLADDLAASATPVREALHQLLGEGLVETRRAGGFYLPAWDEPALRDCYAWSAEVVRLALRHPAAAQITQPPAESGLEYADRTGALFSAIAARSPNAEHGAAIERLNARLHAVRSVEPLVLTDANAETSVLTSALAADEVRALRRLNAAYHYRRARHAAAIVRAVYRSD
jgi:DNA-binding GntR family transcriptional regulator